MDSYAIYGLYTCFFCFFRISIQPLRTFLHWHTLLHLLHVCPQANEYSLPPLNGGLEDVKPSLSTSASSELASSVSQSYSVVTGTIWLTLQEPPLHNHTTTTTTDRPNTAAVGQGGPSSSGIANCFAKAPRLRELIIIIIMFIMIVLYTQMRQSWQVHWIYHKKKSRTPSRACYVE